MIHIHIVFIYDSHSYRAQPTVPTTAGSEQSERCLCQGGARWLMRSTVFDQVAGALRLHGEHEHCGGSVLQLPECCGRGEAERARQRGRVASGGCCAADRAPGRLVSALGADLGLCDQDTWEPSGGCGRFYSVGICTASVLFSSTGHLRLCFDLWSPGR